MMTPGRLTFDDGPSGSTGRILDLLSHYGVRAHFFVIGRRALERPELVERAAADGHVVGNHTWDHARLSPLARDADVIAQLSKANDAIAEITGNRAQVFRAPYGLVDTRVERLASTLGLTHMGWDVDTEDFRASATASIVEAIVSAPADGIVLLHDGNGAVADGPNERPLTVDAVRAALAVLATRT